MTAQDVIDRVDGLIPNTLPRQEKLRWVEEAEQRLACLLPAGEGPRAGQLRAIFPWDSLYLHYLEMQIYYFQGETARQNQAKAMFDAVYSGYRDWCNRTCRQADTRVRYR